jgi:hypothetical protein
MTGKTRRGGLLIGLVLALGCLIGLGGVGPVAVPDAAAALPAWHGGIDLYRKGTFTTQKSWLWCTAADVQIMRNIVRRQSDHTTSGQRTYFSYMRRHNRYSLPLSAGVDPAGWTAGLRHYVDDRYRLVASTSFSAALRSAVTNLRRTNLPVGITVSHGNHAWILTGFTATADPLATTKFTVTSVRVVGPLYGLQSRNGYDMPPDTKLTPTQLKHYFTPWRYAPKRMVWDGRYVSIQPIPARAQAAASAPKATPVPPATALASAAPSAIAAASPVPTPSAEASPSASTGTAESAVAAVPPTAGSGPSDGAAPAGPVASDPTGLDGPGAAIAILIVAAILAGAVLVVGIGRAGQARNRPRLHSRR